MKAVSAVSRLAAALVIFGVLSCSASAAGKVTGNLVIKGSDTMVNLGQVWAEAFMQKYPSTNIAVTGGGSGTGVAALINGTTDICQSSREMKPTEAELAKKRGHDPQETIVGLDGIAVVINPKNPVKELTVAQLRKIFTGEATSWREFGGRDTDIIILSREVSSGTHVYFKEHVLQNKNFRSDALLMPSSQAIVDEVGSNAGAIGYVGIAYGEHAKVKMVPVKKDADSPGVPATEATVKSGKYPISRPLFVYTTGNKSIVRSYISFMLSDAGQKILKDVGFVPLR